MTDRLIFSGHPFTALLSTQQWRRETDGDRSTPAVIVSTVTDATFSRGLLRALEKTRIAGPFINRQP